MIAYISRTDRDIDKRKTAFTTTINSRSKAKKLVNLCSQTTNFCCLISNHPSLTLRLLYIITVAFWPRDCCEQNFSPLTVPNRTYGAGRPHFGLCPLFLVYYEIVRALYIQNNMKIHIKSSTQKLIEFLENGKKEKERRKNVHTHQRKMIKSNESVQRKLTRLSSSARENKSSLADEIVLRH